MFTINENVDNVYIRSGDYDIITMTVLLCLKSNNYISLKLNKM